MIIPGFISSIRAPRGVLQVALFAALSTACAAESDEAGSSGGVTETGGAGAVPDGAGGAPSAGGDVGSGGLGSGGASPNGGQPTVGAGGASPTGGAPAGGVYGSGGVSAGTGGASAGTGGVVTGSGGTSASVTCSPIVNGTSTVVVNGATRTFAVQLPADTSHVALLFLWHGWMQAPTDFQSTVVYDVPKGKWVPFDPNAFPMPLVIVTPYDLKLLPPLGLDWDIVSGEKDFPFFEAMLQCIGKQFDLDQSRIYSFGFSAGAVFTDLLSAKYPHLFAATVSESGAWFNDQTQWSDVSIPIITWNWPAFNPADRGNVLLTHGGSGDYATVISLESTNKKALPFLYDNGRTVTECAHNFGHTLDPDVTQGMYYEWLWAHSLGGGPISGLPGDFPTPQHPVGPTTCTFHPYP